MGLILSRLCAHLGLQRAVRRCGDRAAGVRGQRRLLGRRRAAAAVLELGCEVLELGCARYELRVGRLALDLAQVVGGGRVQGRLAS